MGSFDLVFKVNLEADALSTFISSSLLFNGPYIQNGYIPATEFFEDNSRTIAFPDIEYSKFPNYWELAKEHNLGTIPSNQEVLEFLQNEIQASISEEKLTTKLKSLEQFWEKIEKEFMIFLYELKPELKDKKIPITVNSKTYGTRFDFNSPEVIDDKFDGYISIRLDSPNRYLISALFSTLLTNELDKIFRWREKKAIIDFLTTSFLHRPEESEYFVGTIETLSKLNVDKKLLKNSSEFLQKNKISLDPIVKLNKNRQITIFNNLVKLFYTEKDILIIEEFIKKEDHIITYDEIADIMWGDEAIDKFSLTGISKRIERLRNKLHDDGMPRSSLMAVRGIGYYLNC